MKKHYDWTCIKIFLKLFDNPVDYRPMNVKTI